nr:hypothetical protein [uncultured Niameybacter sp.]
MKFRIISLPPFKAATSGVDKDFNFSPEGILGKFDAYFSSIVPSYRDSFMPRDFLYYDLEKQGMVWMWALTEDMDDGGYELIDFEGGYYLAYAYQDGNDIANEKLYNKALKYIEKSGIFELDIRTNHYAMGHIITPSKIIEAQGWAQMETFIPIKLK